MKPYATADFETDPFKTGRIPQVFAAFFFDGKTHRVWWGEKNLPDFVKFIRNFDGYIYFHNGGKFDLHYLFPFLDPETDEDIFIISGRITKWKFGKAELRDSYSILPVALKQFEKQEIDYSKFEADQREKHKREIIEYGKSDCENQYNMITGFFDRFGMNLTLASTAFRQLKKEYKVEKVTETFDETFRKFYFGGRVTPFQTGVHKGKFEYIDINSAYPNAMLSKHWFSRGYICSSELPRFGVSYCFIHLRADARGCFPKRKEDGGLDFPYEFGEYFVTGWEYMAAKETGTVSHIEILAVYIPDEVTDFSRFIKPFYEDKLEAERNGDKEARLHAKLLLNGSYGKFATNPKNFRDHKITAFGDCPPNREKEGWTVATDYLEFGFTIWEKPAEIKGNPFVNVATAASITGCVRAFMWKSICAVDTPLYCDTDSIICKGTGSLILSDALGDWKREASGSEVRIAGKKLYAFLCDNGDWKVASKGVKFSPDQILAVCNGKNTTWESESPSYGIKSHMNHETGLKNKRKQFVKREIKGLKA